MSRRAGVVVVVVVSIVASLFGPATIARAAGPERVVYRPPVDAVVFDPWRAPKDDYAAGNRGVDYRTTPGQLVFAAADGIVTFAGNIGTTKHVVVLHADGIRTSYSFLDGITVRRGQHLKAGDQVGIAGNDLHFGARAGDAYLDPTVLLAGDTPKVLLVPDFPSEAADRKSLWDHIRNLAAGGLNVTADAAAFLTDQARAVAGQLPNFVLSSLPIPDYQRLVVAIAEWKVSREHCTPPEVAPPPVRGNRIIIRVGGIESSGDGKGVHGGISGFDPRKLGYAEGNIVDFSYRGGTTKQNPYVGKDTEGDLRVVAHRLAALIRDVQARNPGALIDVAAHSQGGLVSQLALAELGPTRPGAPTVEHLLTFATPHTGSPSAATIKALRRTFAGAALAQAAADRVADMDTSATAVAQLAPDSKLITAMPAMPSSVEFTSIAGSGDLAVPGAHARREGADNRVVDVPGVKDQHSDITGSKQGMREAALALTGMAETCKSLATWLRQVFTQDGIDALQRHLGGRLAAVTDSLG